MPEWSKMILVLTLVSGTAGLGLAAVNANTRDAIAENMRGLVTRAVAKVVPDEPDPRTCEARKPGFDNEPDQDAVCVDGFTVYRARRGGDVVGVAVKSVGERAYSGKILVLVGLALDGRVTGLEILQHAETPGLGSKITDCAFKGQFLGKGPADMTWKPRKDGGDVDQLTGATITTRSVLDAVTKAQKLVSDKREAILAAKPMAAGEVCDGR